MTNRVTILVRCSIQLSYGRARAYYYPIVRTGDLRLPLAPTLALLVWVLAVPGGTVACRADPRPPDRAPAHAPAPAPARLKLASWNLEWLNRHDHEGRVPRTREDYARLREYAALLDADIVALQEVDGAEAAGRVFDPAVYSFHLTADEGYLQRTGFAYRKTLEVSPNRDLVGLSIGGTRRGADLTVRLPGGPLRLLSVHLKSGCWSGPLTAATPACGILRAELPVLESWIDARAREGIPFAVLGDFNRRFGRTDAFWLAIDDGDPPDSDLTDAAAGRRSQCWGGEFPTFIDHLVFSRGAARLLVPGSFEQLMFRPGDREHRATLSDHCPIAVTLMTGELAGPGAPERAAEGDPPTLTAAEAAAHLNEVARVCGVVASTRYARSARGQPTFLNLDSPYPDPIFTVFIRGNNRPAFGRPEVTYAGKRICITGRITLFKETPEIEARRPSQIALAGDPEK